MSRRRFPRKACVAAAAAALIVSGCTSDDLTDSIRPSMADHKAAKGSSAKIAALMRVAASTAAAGDLTTAVGLYRRAHEMDPHRVAPLVALGRTLLALGDFNQAAETFRTAISISKYAVDPKKRGAPEAAHGLGNALVALQQPKSAISQFEHAMMQRHDPRTYNGIGVAYDMLGHHAAAQAYYRTGLETDPNNLNLQNNLGLSLAVVGKHDEAIAILKKANRNPKASSRQRLNLALVYGLANRNEEAAQVARADLDETAIRNNLAYYATLRAMKNKKALLQAIGSHSNGFHPDPDAPDLSKHRNHARNKGQKTPRTK